jgi:hypothetical protein
MAFDHDLLESDRAYYESGARLIPLPGGVLAYAEGLASMQGGSTVHRIDARRIAPDSLEWLIAVESRLSGLGVSRARLVLDRPAPELEWAMSQFGYQAIEEVGYVRPATATATSIELFPVADQTAWDQVAAIYAEDSNMSAAVSASLALDQQKQRRGYLRMFLARKRGAVCGAVSVADAGMMLRLQQLIVAPAQRQRGIAAAIIRATVGLAHGEGKAAVGCFAPQGQLGAAICLKGGFTPVIKQSVWTRVLAPVISARASRRAAAFR